MPIAIRLWLRGLAAVMALVALPRAYGGEPPSHAVRSEDRLDGYASTHIVVKFAPGVLETPALSSLDPSKPQGKAKVSTLPPEPPARLKPALKAVWNQWPVAGMRAAYPNRFADPESAARHGLNRTYILEVPAGTDTRAMATAIAAFDDQVEFAEVDAIGSVADYIPNDEYFLLYQWGMHNFGQRVNGVYGTPDADIDAPEAWELHTGDYGTVTVAIVDTGVSPHPEFEDRLLPGHNTVNPDTPDLTIDGCPHGTHVAGIVAAAGDNGIGVAGVTWGAYILPVRVMDGCGGFETHAAEGIIWAVDNGADIINVSLQYCLGGSNLEDAVNYAHDQNVLVIAAAGNSDAYPCAPAVTAPARFANSMAVTATNLNDMFAGFSNYGPEVDVCAPGAMIYSTLANFYTFKDGTSMAAPHVSGLAALIKSYEPGLTSERIRQIITTTADDLGPVGWDNKYGYGRINAYNALVEARVPRIVAGSPPDGAIDARQPSEPDGSNPDGWQEVDLTFNVDTTGLTVADFAVAQEGGVGDPPSVISLVQVEFGVVRVVLDAPISVRAWTTITHVASGTSVRLGYLPGDVSGDGVSSAIDILTLIDALNGAIEPLPIWSTDVDRSGLPAAADILREIDLLGGADSYDPFVGVTLP